MIKKTAKVIAARNSHHFVELGRYIWESRPLRENTEIIFYNRLVLATDINRKISFLIVNLLRTTHGGSRYIVSGKNSLNGKGQSNLIGPNVSATEGTTPGLT